MKPIYDVAIAGGGPAGSAAALELARLGKRVILFEAADFSKNRIGETIAPPVTALLKKLGLWEQFILCEHLPCWGNRSAWGTEALEVSSFIFNPYGNGWHLDRNRFDRMLFEAAKEAGAVCFTDNKVMDVQYNGHFTLQVVTNQQSVSIHSRFFIDATGRSAHFARRLGGNKITNHPLVAHYVQYDNNHESKCGMLVEAVPDGWWYSAPIPGNKLVSIYFTDAEGSRHLSRTGWEACIDKTVYIREMTGNAIKNNEPKIVATGSHRIDKKDRITPWIACGDALMSVDPLSSSGIQHAIENGIRAANVVAEWLAGHTGLSNEFEQHSIDSYRDYLKLRASYYAMEKRWPNSAFWKNQMIEEINQGHSFSANRLSVQVPYA